MFLGLGRPQLRWPLPRGSPNDTLCQHLPTPWGQKGLWPPRRWGPRPRRLQRLFLGLGRLQARWPRPRGSPNDPIARHLPTQWGRRALSLARQRESLPNGFIAKPLPMLCGHHAPRPPRQKESPPQSSLPQLSPTPQGRNVKRPPLHGCWRMGPYALAAEGECQGLRLESLEACQPLPTSAVRDLAKTRPLSPRRLFSPRPAAGAAGREALRPPAAVPRTLR